MIPYFKRFKGRDRRLYYNKAVVELSMGHSEQATITCKSYLQPIKRVMLKLEEWRKKNDIINTELPQMRKSQSRPTSQLDLA